MSRARGDERAEVEEHRPLYARMLRLRHLTPSGFLCFVFLEGAIALGVLLALAELVSWWGVLVLPATVALMVKLNDVIAGSLTRTPPPARPRSDRPRSDRPRSDRPRSDRPRSNRPVTEQAAGVRPVTATGPSSAMVPPGVGEGATTRLPPVINQGAGAPINRPWAERVEAQQQWARQAATRRYE